MGRDASLDDFGGAAHETDDADTSGESEASPSDGQTAATDEAGRESIPDSALGSTDRTSVWRVEPRPCADCDAGCHRLWPREGDFVCSDCVDWSGTLG